ncbi:TetR/AcrR family transcriptional regulator [Cognatishimia sp.]|uniref:TetR/AcrR family transcriptional regulator n=1 Tax=Cognatishimia sp. TaxID=2211648 RepID=UPI003517E6CF
MRPVKTSKNRKGEIVAAAANLLAQQGEAGFSLREVAKVVGIKLASLQYHFPTREMLVTAVLNDVMDGYVDQVGAALETAGDDPEEQLRIAARALCEDTGGEGTQQRLEIHLWSMALNDVLVRDALDDSHREYIENICEMILAARPSLSAREARRRAVVIASMYEGSMLFTDEQVTGVSQNDLRETIYHASIEVALAP